jgi:hypothetical protein
MNLMIILKNKHVWYYAAKYAKQMSITRIAHLKRKYGKSCDYSSLVLHKSNISVYTTVVVKSRVCLIC